MNGLTAILSSITQEAEDQVRTIAEQASRRCAATLKAARLEAVELVNAARQQAERQAALILRNAASMAELEAHKALLIARQALIDEVITQAAASLAVVPDQEKWKWYSQLLLNHATGRETIIFTESDMVLGEKLVEQVNRENGWRLTVDPTPGHFAAGLVLSEKLVQTNLTTDLLARQMRPELVVLAARTLFERGQPDGGAHTEI